MTKRSLAVSTVAAVIIFVILNMGVNTKQGINYKIRTYKIPLYIKIVEFLDRDYRYKALSREIVSGAKNDNEKVLAIFNWVKANIKTDFPKEWPIYDDHIFNIVIRGYGTDDQLADVFTALCAYAGFPAGWIRVEIPGQDKKLVLSLVNIEGRWCVADVFRGIFFTTDRGKFVSTDDILAGRYESSEHIDKTSLAYGDYFKRIGQYVDDVTLRAKKQMPVQRFLYEVRNIFVHPKAGSK